MNFRHLLGCGTMVKVRNFLDGMARKSHDVNGLVWKFGQALIVYKVVCQVGNLIFHIAEENGRDSSSHS